jgi:hypothetical protein
MTACLIDGLEEFWINYMEKAQVIDFFGDRYFYFWNPREMHVSKKSLSASVKFWMINSVLVAWFKLYCMWLFVPMIRI